MCDNILKILCFISLTSLAQNYPVTFKNKEQNKQRGNESSRKESLENPDWYSLGPDLELETALTLKLIYLQKQIKITKFINFMFIFEG